MINVTDLTPDLPEAGPVTPDTDETENPYAPQPPVLLACGHTMIPANRWHYQGACLDGGYCPKCKEQRPAFDFASSGAWPRVRSAAVAAAPRLLRLAMVAVPVVLVNAVAFSGQLAFLRDHLPWSLAGQVMVAAALESVAVYLAYHAHVAQVSNDSSLRLRLASYLFALGIAAMNYSHYASYWRPTFPAVAFALMSASSPWLWAVHSRRTSRDTLLAQGQIDHHAVRLGATRWLWHPIRSAKVMWVATWEGITTPAEAIAAADAAELPALELDTETLAAMSGQARLAAAFGAIGAVDMPRALALLKERGAPLDQSHGYQLRKIMLDGPGRTGSES
jgi:hypothetical protein